MAMVYDRVCDSCEYIEETIEKMMDSDPKECPKCHNKNFRRAFSTPSFHLKGDGFHNPGFKAAKKKK